MSEYIEREALLKEAVKDKAISACIADIVDVRNLINDAPAADVVEVRHGVWQKSLVLQTDTSALYEYTCSECAIVSGVDCNFCPNCGADMRGGKNGNE